ncbi:Protein SUPPRESSOR OF K(+) TRANSPORT GROWTH DEFECT 1 [Capsicum annuum]|uniref:Protein SUPPRESSOR OF K(+) TRANSPORT GROWTH DEFECT 1 n=1 Tax=Capsicum annuum TaxID=4072 RepID=A0A2G2Y5X8_CAPAN|nr:Protein SUPPRESSOR OF K(+) TRANSPORT GROWTH DEFECT 1 [Capsicum annuum]
MYNNFKEKAVAYYEKNPKIKEAIIQKFVEYLRRAEEIRAVLDEVGGGPTSNGDGAVASRTTSKPKNGGGEGDDSENVRLRAGVNSAIIREKPNVKWNDVAGLESAKQALQEATSLSKLSDKLATIGMVKMQKVDNQQLEAQRDKALSNLQAEEDRLALMVEFTKWNFRRYNLEETKAGIEDLDAKILEAQGLESEPKVNMMPSPTLSPADLDETDYAEEVDEDYEHPADTPAPTSLFGFK